MQTHDWPRDHNNEPLTADEVVDLATDGDRQCLGALRARMNQEWVEHAIAGALRSTIDAHGPITREGSNIGSAAKRIATLLTADA